MYNELMIIFMDMQRDCKEKNIEERFANECLTNYVLLREIVNKSLDK